MLSSWEKCGGFVIRRDGEFQNLGFLTDRRIRMLSFLESERFLPTLLRNSCVCALLTTPELARRIPDSLALAVCEEPRIGFATLHNELAADGYYWPDAPTFIDPRAKVHARAWVAERNVTIGPHSMIGPNATILERCSIGASVTIGGGAVLGAVGFQTARRPGALVEMSHAGGLVVRDGAHILHGAVIATGLFRDNTEIGCDARIGARAFVSHGVQVGDRAFVGHGAVVNGNVAIGSEAWIGPGAVIGQNLKVGTRAFVSLGSIVIRNVAARTQVSGNFAISHRRMLRHMAGIESNGDVA